MADTCISVFLDKQFPGVLNEMTLSLIYLHLN